MCVTGLCTPRETITSFFELRRHAQRVGPKRVAVVVADDEVALMAAADALRLRIARPVLIGDEQKIRAQATALGLDELLAGAEFIGTRRCLPRQRYAWRRRERSISFSRGICAPMSCCAPCWTK